MLSRVKLTNAHTVRGRPTLKNNTECFRNGLVRELKEKQRKLSRHSMTSKTHGPHRRTNKSEYQECTCKMDKSLNRGMFNKFDSRKICVAGYQSSSETQGQSVWSEEKAGRKFLSTGERAPGYRLSPNYFQKFKRMPAPDWAQKMLCIIVPNRRTVSLEFFS